MALPRGGNTSTVSRSNWNLACWFLWREENRRTRRKTLGAGPRTNNKLTATCDARSGNRTRATAVGGERSHHCAVGVILFENPIIMLVYMRYRPSVRSKWLDIEQVLFFFFLRFSSLSIKRKKKTNVNKGFITG